MSARPAATVGISLEGPLGILQKLWEVNHALERVSLGMERTLGVTAQQRFVIRCVGKFPGITMGQLAGILHLDPGTVSATVKRLEARGLVSRRRDPRDSRRVCLGLTDDGRTLDELQAGTVEHAVSELFLRCPRTDVQAALDVLSELSMLLDAEPAPETVPRRSTGRRSGGRP
ncbi:MAG TPA: MarR family transcriptional regulator [Polyangiaceae bacterium]|nr:MarR family transcriptional regulator [Polyangiaceae bacterium]